MTKSWNDFGRNDFARLGAEYVERVAKGKANKCFAIFRDRDLDEMLSTECRGELMAMGDKMDMARENAAKFLARSRAEFPKGDMSKPARAM